MKKLFQLFLLMALLPIAAQAQITIQADDVQPLGVFATQVKDSTLDASITPGGTGQQTWDFSALKIESTDSLKFYTPNETAYASYFPSANLAVTVDSYAVIYLIKDNDRIATLGTYGTLHIDPISVTTSFTYTPPQSVIRFPMEFGQTYTENLTGRAKVTGAEVGYPVDSVRYTTTIARTVTVDAYGELTTPVGTFDVLRTTEVEVSSAVGETLSNGIWFPAITTDPKTITVYNWWTNQNGIGFPVVQYKDSPDTGTSALWLNEFVSATHDSKNFLNFDISPNPASNFLNVKLPDGFTGQMQVFDLNGRQQVTQQAASGNNVQLDIASLPTGSFVLILKDKKGKVSGFERFEVIR